MVYNCAATEANKLRHGGKGQLFCENINKGLSNEKVNDQIRGQ